MAPNFIYFSVGFKFWERFGHHLGGDVYIYVTDFAIWIKFWFGFFWERLLSRCQTLFSYVMVIWLRSFQATFSFHVVLRIF